MSGILPQFPARAARVVSAAAFGVVCAARGDVSFSARTIPAAAGLSAAVKTVREGDVWRVSATARNDGATNVTFKLVLAAEPGFPAARYLIPGVNYNGNGFVRKMWNSLDIPTGWEKDGEPWVFAYDRCGIPSCTVSENEHEVFALFASVENPASHESACSLEKLDNGSFRHLIYWPVTEAPVSYTDKRKFSPRYDTCLTLRPKETFTARAFACRGAPPWRNYGFAAVFPTAWRLLRPDVPAQLPVSEVLRLDKAFMDWGRRRDKQGSWYQPFLSDVIVGLGNRWPKSVTKGATIAELEKDLSRSWWLGDALEKSKRLKPGEYLVHAGGGIGFCEQSFQLARLSVEYGLRNHSPGDVDFGLSVFRSWIRVRQRPSGHFAQPSPKRRRQDASSVGWGIAELARLATLLRAHGLDAAEFERSADALARAVVRTQRADGNLGAAWDIATGKVTEWSGDSGGFVLMGLVRHWLRTRDDAVRLAIDKAFAYYYSRDIDNFECKGGAMDCASIDREGIHPFFTAAVAMYADTGDERFRTYARKAGWYFLSWLYCHNGIYGPETDFAKYDWKPAGSTIIGTEHAALDDYGCAMVADLMAFSRLDGNPLWRDVAALIWRNATQGFPTETRKVWLGLERPLGAKNEAYFQTRWSKYRTGERKRGHLNSHCTSWAAAHRATAIYDLSAEDLLWLERVTRPARRSESQTAR